MMGADVLLPQQIARAHALRPPLLQCAGFMALAIYFDAVLPDANGVRRPPWFFLTPGFWRRSRVSVVWDDGTAGMGLKA